MAQIKLSVGLLLICAVKCLAMQYNELEDFADYLKKTSQLSPTLKKGVDPEYYDEDEVVSDHAWEESGKFEGDLILNERQRRLIVENVAEGLSRNGIRDGSKRWPNNEVIYYIQVEHFTGDQVQAIQSGIDDLARASCVKFRRYRKGDRDAVVIQGNRRGCFSQVGYQSGYQVLNLSGRHPVGRGCFRHGTVVHEMLHTLGFYHMQSSPDRDDYVNVIWENIVQPARHNFRKYNSFSVSDFGVGYDYDSVLHYSRRAFSANGQDTIVPKKSGAEIGQRVGLSDKDAEKLNKMYCDADSDHVQNDEGATKNTKKRNNKNTPFDGHGIGYHQGKAVVIKLLPSAETYKLPEVPSSYLFDYFSKAPQILSTSQNEGFRLGKEIGLSHHPPETSIIQEYKNSVNPLSNGIEIKPQNQRHNLNNVVIVMDMDHANDKTADETENNEDSSAGTRNKDNDEIDDTAGIDAYDRLTKIIKSHVYPSQTPDLSIYKSYEQLTETEYTPEKKHNVNDEIVSLGPILQEDKNSYDLNNNTYDLNPYHAVKKLGKQYYPNTEIKVYYEGIKEESHKKEMPVEEIRSEYKDDRKSVNPSYITTFLVNDAYENKHSPSPDVSLQRYREAAEDTKYTSNLPGGQIAHKNNDGWRQKYTPYKYNSHKSDREPISYMDYLKHTSERDEYNDANPYSSTVSIILKDPYHNHFPFHKYNLVSHKGNR